MGLHLRVARPVRDIDLVARMYRDGLSFDVLSSFRDHDGFDGIMIGPPGGGFHLEFTRHRHHPVSPVPTPEDLLVFYYPSESEWRRACERMSGAGFQPVAAFNPYWDVRGRTFRDPDGYRVVLQQDAWTPLRA